MRAREFISEAKGPQGTRTDPAKEFERAHPGMVMPGGRGDVYWGRYYDFYRVASLAGMDPKDIDAVDEVGFFGNLPVFSAYTEYDRDKLKAIMKKLRMKPTDGVSNGSREVEEVNSTSPVKSFRGYPR
jgi:hypothetical protein